jgi:hypothetical protein
MPDYWDRPREAWPRLPEGELAMFTRRLDLKEIEHQTLLLGSMGSPTTCDDDENNND